MITVTPVKTLKRNVFNIMEMKYKLSLNWQIDLTYHIADDLFLLCVC